jgi:hypothetical protein
MGLSPKPKKFPVSIASFSISEPEKSLKEPLNIPAEELYFCCATSSPRQPPASDSKREVLSWFRQPPFWAADLSTAYTMNVSKLGQYIWGEQSLGQEVLPLHVFSKFGARAVKVTGFTPGVLQRLHTPKDEC